MDTYRVLQREFLFAKIFLRPISKRYKDLNPVKWASNLVCIPYTKENKHDN